MKILAIHSDFFSFEPKKKAISLAEEAEKKEVKINECLVIFSAVEKTDEKNKESAVNNYINEIEKIAKQVNEKNIVLYPYAHLSSDLASPNNAIKILKDAENKLSKKYNTVRAPFGWYKSFEIKCKGHPLSELSRDIGLEKEAKSEALEQEKKLKSYWYIMDLKGKLHDVKKFNFKNNENLKKFASYEMEKSRAALKEPAHAALMKRLELVDYEPGSDSGNLRYYPKGRLIKKLIEEYVSDRVIDYGGVEVETPIMYDISHPTLSKYLQRFPARWYQIESDKRNFFLRFSACFGQFLMAHDATISYRHLPLKLYELTRYSFRREQSGELTGLRRLRAFTMPDVHAICSDIKQAMNEFKTRFKLCLDVQKKIGLTKDDFELAIRFTEDFYKKNEEFIELLVKSFGKPALIEMWKERSFYFILKYEFNFVDSLDKASALSTDQIDIENGERYNIMFSDKDGKKKYPIILHCSPSGAIERVIYALLEKAAIKQKNKKTPMLPLWLTPTQIRVIPVSEKYFKFAERIADKIREEKIRADFDDRTLHVGKKIRDAEIEWCSTVVVIGKKELKSKRLPVRIRGIKKIKVMNIKKLINYIKENTKDMPFKQLPLPKELSKRPSFT